MSGDGDLRLVTPEAVVLELRTAGLGSRLLAMLVDALIQLILLIGVLVAAAVTGGGDSALLITLLIAGVFLVVVGYPVLFETLWRGRTPGKAAMGLRVVTTEGSPERFRHAAVRSLIGLVEIYTLSGALAVVAILASRSDQRLGDMAAGTLVIRERTGLRQPSATVFEVPPGCDAYVATLDVSGLSSTEYGAVRSYLLRAPSLPPAVRDDLARRLAEPLAQRLHHQPPPQLGHERFLACIAAAYQQRSRRSMPSA